MKQVPNLNHLSAPAVSNEDDADEPELQNKPNMKIAKFKCKSTQLNTRETTLYLQRI